MAENKNKRQILLVPVDLVNDAEDLKRIIPEDLDDLRRLGENMLAHGQINPVTLIRVGNEYQVVAGQRRVKAARLVKMTKIQAQVIDPDPERVMMIRWSENAERLQNNVIEEAMFIRQMLEKLKITQAELASKIGKSTAYVSQRVHLSNAPGELQQALFEGQIAWDVARELLMFDNTKILLRYLRYAVDAGANARVVRNWRNDAKLMQDEKDIEAAIEQSEPLVEAKPENRIYYCDVCRESHFIPELTYIRVCRKCENIIKSTPESQR